ncbi:hypothetical protein NMG60_11024335 [Bertholletia excelsa]
MEPMGRKKMAKKTEELSVAIAVSSCTGTEHLEQQQTPRKRGRPRKIVEKAETEEIKQEAEVTESDLKKAKEEEEEDDEEEQRGPKELQVGDAGQEGELPREVKRSSRARRKSKPQKSS